MFIHLSICLTLYVLSAYYESSTFLGMEGYVALGSCVQFFVTTWTVVAHQAPLSMGFSRKEHWSGLPFPSPGGLPDLGIEHTSRTLVGGFFAPEPPGKLWL